MVRRSAINGHGQSAGDARNPLRIIELEVVARDGVEPSTRDVVGRARCPEGVTQGLQARRPRYAQGLPSFAAVDDTDHQLTGTSFEHVIVPASHTLYVAVLTFLGGLSV